MKKSKLVKAFGISLSVVAGLSLVACGSDKKKDDSSQTTQYTVEFFSNGANETFSNKLVDSGSKLTGLATPTKASTSTMDYTFAGWYTTPDFQTGTEFDIATSTVTSNLKLYAKWTESPKTPTSQGYTVTYVSAQGSAPTAVTNVKEITSAMLTAMDNVTGYEFKGWYLDSGFTQAATAGAITANTTLYAKWEAVSTSNPDEPAQEYKVKFIVGDQETIVDTVNGKVTKPADPTKAGDANYVNHIKRTYTFAGWYNGDVLFDFDSVITSAIDLTARFTENKEIESGWEEVISELDTNIFKSALTAGTDVKSGPFTLKGNGNLATRSRARVYAEGTPDQMSFTHSMKLDDKGSFRVTATGDGVLTIIIQNGSGGVSSQKIIFGEVVDGVVNTSSGTEYEFDPSALVKYEFKVQAGKEYYVARPSGTVDIYYAKLNQVMEEAPINGIEITTNGTQEFFAGSTFNTSGLSVVAVKENGAKLAVDNADLTIDSSAVNMSEPGTYTVTVKYQEYPIQSYDVTVYALDNIELGFNKIEKLATNSAAGNGQYFNQTVQQVYGLNDTLDKDALTIKAYAAEKVYGEYISLDSSAVSYSDVDMSTAGEKTITITVTLNGISKSETCIFYVVDTDICKVTEGETVTEVNVYVDPRYTGVVGAATTVGAISKECNTFKTIQQALDYLGMQDKISTARKNVYIAAGTYCEKLEITLPYISLIGLSGKENTIIEWDSIYGRADEGGFIHVTDSTATVAIRDTAVNCIIDGVTISNHFNTIESFVGTELEGNGERGLAMLVQSDMFILQNSSLLGWQDTLELFTGRQLIKNSYISGCVDFIFGTNNTTLFDNCEIHAVKGKSNATAEKVSAYLTAFKGCNRGDTDYINYGAIFNQCNFTADSDFVGKIAVGRCWGAYSAVSIINSTFCEQICTKASEAIVTMNAQNNAETLKYFFYGNTQGGEAYTLIEDLNNASGSAINHALTETEAQNYVDYTKIFGMTNGAVAYKMAWNPEYTGVIVDNNIYYDFGSLSSTTGTVHTMENTVGGAYQATLGGLTIDTAKCQKLGTYTEVQAGTMTLTVPARAMLTINTGYGTEAALTVNGLGLTTASFVHYYEEETVVTLTFSGKVYLLGIQVTPNATKPEDPTITSVVIEGAPADELAIGTQLDLSGLKVKLIYSDNTYMYTTDFTTNAAEINFSTPGEKTIVVTCGEFTDSFTVNVVESVDTTISETTGFTFKGTTYTGTNVINCNSDATILLDGTAKTYKNVTYTGCSSHGANDWLTFNSGATITFKVSEPCTLNICFYNGSNNATVSLNGETVTTKTYSTGASQSTAYAYEITEAGTVTITSTGNGYIGFFEVVFPESAE